MKIAKYCNIDILLTLKLANKRGTKDTKGTDNLINPNQLTTPWLKTK